MNYLSNIFWNTRTLDFLFVSSKMQPILYPFTQKKKKYCILYLAKSQLVLLSITIKKADTDRATHTNCKIKKVKKKRMKISLIFLFTIQPL